MMVTVVISNGVTARAIVADMLEVDGEWVYNFVDTHGENVKKA